MVHAVQLQVVTHKADVLLMTSRGVGITAREQDPLAGLEVQAYVVVAVGLDLSYGLCPELVVCLRTYLSAVAVPLLNQRNRTRLGVPGEQRRLIPDHALKWSEVSGLLEKEVLRIHCPG